MKNWTPPPAVSKKEIVGRRVFGSRVFDETPLNLRYKLDTFLDKRIGTRLSVDRLGVRKANSEVLAFLIPLCDSSAIKRSSTFTGWAQISASDLQQIGIQSTEAINEINPYHAEILRSDYQTVDALRSLAFRLCVYAAKHEFIYRSSYSQ